jgi:hypothetical protein
VEGTELHGGAAAENHRKRDTETEDERESTREGSHHQTGAVRREQPRAGKMAGAKPGTIEIFMLRLIVAIHLGGILGVYLNIRIVINNCDPI